MTLEFNKAVCWRDVQGEPGEVAEPWQDRCVNAAPNFPSCLERAFTKPAARDRSYSVDQQPDKEVHSCIINNLLRRIVPPILDTTDKWRESS